MGVSNSNTALLSPILSVRYLQLTKAGRIVSGGEGNCSKVNAMVEYFLPSFEVSYHRSHRAGLVKASWWGHCLSSSNHIDQLPQGGGKNGVKRYLEKVQYLIWKGCNRPSSQVTTCLSVRSLLTQQWFHICMSQWPSFWTVVFNFSHLIEWNINFMDIWWIWLLIEYRTGEYLCTQYTGDS